jgi:hypothetical protein
MTTQKLLGEQRRYWWKLRRALVGRAQKRMPAGELASNLSCAKLQTDVFQWPVPVACGEQMFNGHEPTSISGQPAPIDTTSQHYSKRWCSSA